MKLLAEARFSVVSETMQLHPLRRARASSARISRNCKALPAMTFQNPDTAEISRVESTRRGHQSGKGDRYRLMIYEPPVAPIEFRNGGTAKECQAMQVGERIRDFVVMPVDLANPVHRPVLQNPRLSGVSERHLRHRRAFSISLSETPLARAQDSTPASPYWATAFLTTQQGIPCAGKEATSAATTTIARIIFRA